MVGIAASRSDRDFSEHDRVMLNALRPHLAQGWRNAKEQIRLRSLLEAAGDAAAESGGGLIVLSDPPQEVTAGSVVQLYRYFGRPSRSGPMPTRVERWIDLQRARLSDSDAPRLLRPLTANLDGHSLVLRYLPAQGYHPGAIVLREDGHNLVGRDLQAFGLGEREAQVVRLLVTGASNAAIATALSISLATVKKHLENIYRKVGVHGRGPLTAYVLDFASS
jgi:DNA-binding CsgD family transcriptional regulator